jgi:hypothetical protein
LRKEDRRSVVESVEQPQPCPQKGGDAYMKRMVSMVSVALVTVAMMVAMAMPALAAKPAPTRGECLAVQAALIQGENLTGQQKQLIRQFPNLGQCIAASEG